MRNLGTTVGTVLFASLVFGAPAYSQKVPSGPPQPAPSAKPERMVTAEEQEHAIKVRVNEVIVPVTILNSKGEMIFGLTKSNFHIFDNGVEQNIEQFDLGGDP